jgi:hypothetical protein
VLQYHEHSWEQIAVGTTEFVEDRGDVVLQVGPNEVLSLFGRRRARKQRNKILRPYFALKSGSIYSERDKKIQCMSYNVMCKIKTAGCNQYSIDHFCRFIDAIVDVHNVHNMISKPYFV